MLYFFILGSCPLLSLAEIVSVFGEQVKLASFADNFVVFAPRRAGREATPNHIGCGVEFGKELNPSKILNTLGGSIKFGEIIEGNPKNLSDLIFYALARQGGVVEPRFTTPQGKENKLFFGISAYGKQAFKTREVGLEIKKRIKEAGRSCRFVVSREKNLSSVVVKTNKLLSPQGAEFVILDDGKKKFLGKTLAVQEFEEYEKRDFPKPARSMLRGMLPPKLAKMMVNLADAPKDGVILDPFCGTGTILGEAILLGYKNIIGADIDSVAIRATEENLQWLHQNFQFPPTTSKVLDGIGTISNFQLFNIDAREISKQFKKQMIDAIVTEPYLGPPMKGNESLEQIRGLIVELEKLYLESFREFKKILKPSGSVVFVLPIFVLRLMGRKTTPNSTQFGVRNTFGFNIQQQLKKIGFQITNLLPPEIRKNVVRSFNFAFGPNGGLVYGRPDQRIWREVLVLRLKI